MTPKPAAASSRCLPRHCPADLAGAPCDAAVPAGVGRAGGSWGGSWGVGWVGAGLTCWFRHAGAGVLGGSVQRWRSFRLYGASVFSPRQSTCPGRTWGVSSVARRPPELFPRTPTLFPPFPQSSHSAHRPGLLELLFWPAGACGRAFRQRLCEVWITLVSPPQSPLLVPPVPFSTRTFPPRRHRLRLPLPPLLRLLLLLAFRGSAPPGPPAPSTLPLFLPPLPPRRLLPLSLPRLLCPSAPPSWCWMVIRCCTALFMLSRRR